MNKSLLSNLVIRVICFSFLLNFVYLFPCSTFGETSCVALDHLARSSQNDCGSCHTDVSIELCCCQILDFDISTSKTETVFSAFNRNIPLVKQTSVVNNFYVVVLPSLISPKRPSLLPNRSPPISMS